MRIAMGIEYDGASYSGWQSQINAISVQQMVEQALSKVADRPVKVICAGRTDTGVHATEQVIHFETDVEREERAWVFGTNSFLPRDINVQWMQVVSEDFHARFSAHARRYRYLILNRRVRPSILRHKVTWHCRPLAVEAMQEAAKCLIGKHDFTSYRAQECQAKSPIRTITHLSIEKLQDFVIIDVQADAFLQHMVRNISGVLLSIGEGRRPVEWSQAVLDAKNRALGGVTAPPDGLYLIKIFYPEKFKLPSEIKPMALI